MDRKIRQTAYVERTFEDVCLELELNGRAILSRATDDASSRADHLVLHLDDDLSFFDPDETVTLVASSLKRQSDEMASMQLDWRADHHKRILPALDARLLVHAIIQSGPNAMTALSVTGLFAPPPSLRRRVEETLFKRKLIDAVVYRFVHSVAEILEGKTST